MTKPTTMIEVADAADAFLCKGWTAIEPAIDSEGKMVACYSSRAVAWSLLGAIGAVPSDAKVDKLKIQLIGRCKVFLPRDTTMTAVNQGGPAAARALLAKAAGRSASAPGGAGPANGQGAGPVSGQGTV